MWLLDFFTFTLPKLHPAQYVAKGNVYCAGLCDVKVVRVIVWRFKLTRPIVLPIVAYRYMHQSDLMCEAIGTMYIPSIEATRAVRQRLNYEHRSGWRLSLNGMVNITEVSHFEKIC